jgi:hypothetical protein
MPVYCDGWLGNVTVGGDALLWAWGSGEAMLELDSRTPGSVPVAVDGEPRGKLEIPSANAAVELGAPGWHLLELNGAAAGTRVEVVRRS